MRPRSAQPLAALLMVLFASSCAGSAGSNGTDGTNGVNGTNGTNGVNGTNGTAGCDATATAGGALAISLTVSSPASGGAFAAGERPVLAIRMEDGCGRIVAPTALATLALYLSGPRDPAVTRTASKLLNAVTNRSATDGQHHYVNLRAPSYAAPAQANLRTLADGSLSYALAPVSDEAPGTYTAGLWLRTVGDTQQRMVLADLQIGTATVEAYASGPGAASSCRACHLGAGSTSMSLQHAFASSFSPAGLPSLDEAPVASCQLCHNLDGYSRQPTLRKVHGVHRGAHQQAPGAAHPEYGLDLDASLAEFTDVTFPSMPGGELDCAACHVDDRWATRPSRLACGTCHDNLFFDTGTLSPPRSLGRPAGGACTGDGDCAAFTLATCDTASGICRRASHPPQAGDAQCSACHTAASGLSPIPARHAILTRTAVPGLALSQVALGGATAPDGFTVGDVPILTFALSDATSVIADLKTNAAYAATLVLAGPSEAPQRVFGPLALKTTGTLSYDAATGRYTYRFPTAWPASTLPPYNTSATTPSPALPGGYTAYLYVSKAITSGGVTYRDAANALVEVALGGGTGARPRQVVSTAACNGCHVQLQYHGGARRLAEGCGTCHTAGATDRAIGSRGSACSTTAQCPLGSAGWEACTDTNADGVADTCVLLVDPTPAATIAFGPMTHAIHLARRLGGYAERNNLAGSGTLTFLGGATLTSFPDALLSQDPRHCATCHADAGTTCTADAQCGVGQACRAARCENVAWQAPSAAACLSCHDTAAAAGHAALNTWSSPDGPVETCDVCHGPSATDSVATVHLLGPGVLPLPRLP
jgi:hypothetical protein